MREIRLSGSEGGAANARPYPYKLGQLPLIPEIASSHGPSNERHGDTELPVTPRPLG